MEHALFSALRTESPDRFLSRPDLDVSVRGENKQTLLHEAIAFSRTDFVPALLARGVAVDAQNKNGQTALHYAATYANRPAVEFLLKHGASVNIEDKFGNTPAWTAALAARGDNTLVKLMLAHGADPHHKNKAGRSVADFAKQSNNAELLKLCGEPS
jgi:ankyrin repeat protein